MLFQLPIGRVYHLCGPSHSSDLDDTTQPIDWSRFAYVQYVTNTPYLCNSVMLFETLHRLGSKPDRLMMYPASFSEDARDDSTQSRLLRKARDEYGVTLMPIEVQSRNSGDRTWAESYTKLLAFNQTQYDRVLSLDSDATILQTMDELFLAPPSPVAMPRAYWLNFNDHTLSSQVVLIQPSDFEFTRIMKAIDEAGKNDYDMEILNSLYRDSALILPHRPYGLLTGEFRSKRHTDYLGNPLEPWDPVKTFREAKYLHFSDWPVPKPWIAASPNTIQEKQPTCDMNPQTGVEDDCRARDIWVGVYADFAERRKVRQIVCLMLVSHPYEFADRKHLEYMCHGNHEQKE
ncbi:nucleotide-diphospho-sugar transferase [Aspergillus steynii IBT 23096]|uniref:Nucleotide-diphospho-sugar transferase n=1 Tax=Aspergillus steynii IBT 23096 TaxID=1392250 RepID=A0A2I2GPC9_9EURO|nr:nucleotide-diphospho-sugar transferase [Aspergillus steynii IBT 23096]PLB54728.1 nucleotide-diphospho-sugar transferase [Aspergillus steynii IBT 23096]